LPIGREEGHSVAGYHPLWKEWACRNLSKVLYQQNVGCMVEDTLYIKKIDEEFFDA